MLRLLHALKPVRDGDVANPVPGAPADAEMKAFVRSESVQTAYSYGLIALESAGDHLAAYDALVLMQAFSMAPLTCLRGLLEAAAVASWQLDPSIGVRDRVARNLALRFATLTMQRKVANAKSDTAGVHTVDTKIECLEELAIELGYLPIRDKKGRRDGVGCRKPNVSDMLESEFDFRSAYRPLSALAHADPIALFQVGFSGVERASGVAFARKAVNTQLQRDLLASATLLYARPVWYHVLQFGRDSNQAARLLESASDELGLANTNDVRFWRASVRRS